jgi:hypothetical protein
MVAMSNMGGSMRNQDLANALANGSPQPLLVDGIMQLQPPPAANQSDKEKADLFYKTELCKHWEKEGACPYGDKCQFAHGRNQLRFVVRSKKYKTKRCKTFWSTGHCPYGSRCCFLHDPEEDARLLSDMTTFIFDQASGETIETGNGNSPNQRGSGKAKKQDRRQRKGSVGAVGESVPQSSMSTFNQVMGIDPGEKPPAGSGFGGKKQPRGGGQQQQPQRGGVKGGGAPRNGNQASLGRGNRKNPSEGGGGALRKSQSFQNSSQEVGGGFQSPVESVETDGRGKSFSTSFIPGFGDGNLGLVNNNWLFQSSQPVFQYSQPAPESDILFNAPPPQSQQQASWTTDLSNLGVGLDGLTLHGGGPPSGGGSAEVVKRVGSSSSGDVDVTGTSKMPSPMVPDHHLPPASSSSLHQNGLFNTPYPAKTEHVALASAGGGGGDSDKVPGKESGAEAFLQNASTFLLQTAA